MNILCKFDESRDKASALDKYTAQNLSRVFLIAYCFSASSFIDVFNENRPLNIIRRVCYFKGQKTSHVSLSSSAFPARSLVDLLTIYDEIFAHVTFVVVYVSFLTFFSHRRIGLIPSS